MTVRKILALVIGLSMLLGLAACNFKKVEVPSDKEVKNAVEEEYDMKFKLDSSDIAKDGSEAEWVFIAKDGSLQVTVTWNSKKPEKFKMEDETLVSLPSDRDVQKAVEDKYGMSFYLESSNITDDESEATWVYMSDDYTLEVIVTWSAKKPDKFEYNENYFAVPTDPTYTEPANDNQLVFGTGSEIIELWAFTQEVPKMVGIYMDINPEFGERYTVRATIIPTDGGAYQEALDSALAAGGEMAPDIYVAEGDFALKYTQGDVSAYAATYKDLGIDVDNKIKSAEIAPYTVDVGSRNGEVVALAYQSTSGVMIYRSSIAKRVFGTDDPKEIEKIIGAGTGSWDKFMDAAMLLRENGYKAVSGLGDIWPVYETSSSTKWLDSNYNLVISSEREAYLDLAKTLIEDDLTNKSGVWTGDWYSDMQDSNVFCFFGPAWLINYVMIGNSGGFNVGEGSYGDWKICIPPVGFFWGGTWILANKDTAQAEGVAELIEWITLDTSEAGLQYIWANDMFGNGAIDSVPSGVVMAKSRGTMDYLGGQDIFEVFIESNKIASGKGCSQYDDLIDMYFEDFAGYYANGVVTRDEALQDFKDTVNSYFY